MYQALEMEMVTTAPLLSKGSEFSGRDSSQVTAWEHMAQSLAPACTDGWLAGTLREMSKVQKSEQKREAAILLGRGGWMSPVKRTENARPWHLIPVLPWALSWP